MQCQACEKDLPDDARVCGYCGVRLQPSATVETAPVSAFDEESADDLSFAGPRLWPLAVGCVLLFVGAGAWFFWPEIADVFGGSDAQIAAADAGHVADAGRPVEAESAEPSAQPTKKTRRKRIRQRQGKRARAEKSKTTGGRKRDRGEPARSGKEVTGAPAPETAKVLSKRLSSSAVRKELKKRRRAFNACYLSRLKSDQAAGIEKPVQGKISVRFTVAPKGFVTAIKAERDTIGGPNLRRCVLDTFKPIRFERTIKGTQDLLYTFVFEKP